MLIRTWPYGTKRRAEVLSRERAMHQGRMVDLMALVDDQGEGHLLAGTRSDEGQPGDKGTLTFLQGGPMGGYWQFRQDVSPERPAL